jgi:hypothetical protein
MTRECVQDDAGHLLMHERAGWLLGCIRNVLACENRENFDAANLLRFASLHFASYRLSLSLHPLTTNDAKL